MTDPQPTPAPGRRRFQFTFRDLAEAMVGLGLAFALVAELGFSTAAKIVGPMFVIVGIVIYRKHHPNRRIALKHIVYVLPVATCMFCCCFPMAIDVQGPRPRPNSHCASNLRYIAMALHNYHDQWDRLPPAVTRDASGRPMHSWRTLVLPYLEQQAVYDAYDFAQPWDSAVNRAVARQMNGDISQCPSAATPANVVAPTNYFYVVGPGRTDAHDALPTAAEWSNLDDRADTIMLVESDTLVADWFEPRDLTIDEAMRGINPTAAPGISGQHEQRLSATRRRGIVHVAFADGSVRALPVTLDGDTLRAMLSIDGGETIDWSRLAAPSRRFAAAWPVALTFLYVAWIICRHWPGRKAARA